MNWKFSESMSDLNASTIEELLEYYNDWVIPIIATSQVIEGAFPKEALNEFRNALTHMSRAHRLREESGGGADDIRKAQGHLQRAALDAAKNAIAVVSTRTERFIVALGDELALPNDVLTDANKLRDERIALSKQEGESQPTHTLVDGYVTLLERLIDFHERLIKDFGGEAATRRKEARELREVEDAKRRKRERTRERLFGFASGIVASLIASAIWFAFS